MDRSEDKKPKEGQRPVWVLSEPEGSRPVMRPIGGKPDFTLAIGGEKAYNKKSRRGGNEIHKGSEMRRVRRSVQSKPYTNHTAHPLSQLALSPRAPAAC